MVYKRSGHTLAVLRGVGKDGGTTRVLRSVGRASHRGARGLFACNITIVMVNVLLSMFRRTVNVGTILCCTPHVFRDTKTRNNNVVRAIVVNVIGVLFALMTVFAMSHFNHGPLLVVNSVNVTMNTFTITFYSRVNIGNVIPILSVVICTTFFVVS